MDDDLEGNIAPLVPRVFKLGVGEKVHDIAMGFMAHLSEVWVYNLYQWDSPGY